MTALKIIPAALSVVLLSLVTYLAYGFDQWIGMMAYTWAYLLFCVIAAIVIGAAWMPLLNKRAGIAALVAFATLAVHLVMPPPSERILRSALFEMPVGTSAQSIQGIVQKQYDGSQYKMPQISRDEERIYVSLINQEPGNCTGLTIHLRDEKVIRTEYMAD